MINSCMQCYIKLFSPIPPHYEDDSLVMNVSLDTDNNNAIDISTLNLRIWHYLRKNWIKAHRQKWANVPEVSVIQLYRDMINTTEPIHSFPIKNDDEDSPLIWTILNHPGTYIGTISTILYYVYVSTALESGSGLPHWGTSLIPQSLHDMPWWMRQ